MAIEYFTPQMEISYSANTSVGSATHVRVFNGFGAEATVTINNAAATPVNLGSFTLASNTVAFIKKEPAHQINVAAGITAVKMTQVDF